MFQFNHIGCQMEYWVSKQGFHRVDDVGTWIAGFSLVQEINFQLG